MYPISSIDGTGEKWLTVARLFWEMKTMFGKQKKTGAAAAEMSPEAEKQEPVEEAAAAEEGAEASAASGTSGGEAASETSASGSGEEAALLAAAQQEAAELKDRLLRTMADFDNYRKRTLRDIEESKVRAAEGLMKDLLPVLDGLDAALAHVPEGEREAPLPSGVRLVYDQFVAVLGRNGLTPVDAAPGDTFDPNFHEALTQQPSAEIPAGCVLMQFRRGWKLGKYLLRSAQVVVSEGTPEAEVTEAENADAKAEESEA